MYKLVTSKDTQSLARDRLYALFADAPSEHLDLVTRGGPITNAEIKVRADLDLWCHIAKGPSHDAPSRTMCWFGVGEPSKRASIEINIPVGREPNCYGQIVTDGDGRLFLAHHGGLGGGPYTVKTIDFVRLIKDFDRELVEDGEEQRGFFVLADLQSADAPRQIAAYVHEAERIRRLKRAKDGAFERALDYVGGAVIDENDEDSFYQSPGGRKIIRRLHGKVQRALSRRLKGFDIGNERLQEIGPDLYIRSPAGQMAVLFEIKVGRDSQSTFTAIGQLLVYSADTQPTPRRVLISQGLPKNSRFQKVLTESQIEFIRYWFDDDGKVNFDDLERVKSWI